MHVVCACLSNGDLNVSASRETPAFFKNVSIISRRWTLGPLPSQPCAPKQRACRVCTLLGRHGRVVRGKNYCNHLGFHAYIPNEPRISCLDSNASHIGKRFRPHGRRERTGFGAPTPSNQAALIEEVEG
jgi:hypothetical protein